MCNTFLPVVANISIPFLNSTSHDLPKLLFLKSLREIAYGIILPSICAFGILGNILNLTTLRSGALQAVSYMYLRALAAADLFCMIFVLIFVAQAMKIFPTGNYFVHWYAAHLELPLINFFISASVLLVIGLTLERYISIVFPLHFRQWNRPVRAHMIISLAYLISFILHLPMCWEKLVVCYEKSPNLTMYKHKDNQDIKHSIPFEAYTWIREASIRVLPVLVLTYFNIHIIIAFIKVQRKKYVMTRRHSITNGNSNQKPKKVRKGEKDEKRILALLGVITVLFFCCNLPAAINLLVIKDSISDVMSYQTFRACANLLEIANHSVNFYFFCLCSKDYRDEFFKIIHCLKQPAKSYMQTLRRNTKDTDNTFAESYQEDHESRTGRLNSIDSDNGYIILTNTSSQNNTPELFGRMIEINRINRELEPLICVTEQQLYRDSSRNIIDTIPSIDDYNEHDYEETKDTLIIANGLAI